MKIFILSIVLISIFVIKFIVTNQLNEIKKLENEIYTIDKEIEKLKTDYSYITSPKNLKNISETNIKFGPIEQDDIIKLGD